MARCNWRGGICLESLKSSLNYLRAQVKLWYLTLFYNFFTSWATVLDTGMEPLFWFVDNFVRYLGPIFIIVVVGLVSAVVITFYTCLLPHQWHESVFWAIYHLIVGHWFLMNTAFHYYKAAFTDPGTPPQHIPEVVSICKKCVSPKPPRSHHCSVCDKCVLKMDHHCPWLNNCVGHYNHRHFFMFCVFMWIGCLYVSFCAFGVFKEHYYGDSEVPVAGILSWAWFKNIFNKMFGAEPTELETARYQRVYTDIMSKHVGGYHVHEFVTYMFMLSTAASVAVGLLTLWHASLISLGHTSIEVHINKKEKNRMKSKGLVYRNPYHFGAYENWRIFLGLKHGRTFWRHLFLPSGHKPEGNGLQWEHNNDLDPNGLLLL